MFKNMFDALRNPYVRTEVSYLNGIEANYGTKGSIRFDLVVYEDVNYRHPIAAFDIKTGGATLTAGRIQRMQSMSGFTELPISAIH